MAGRDQIVLHLEEAAGNWVSCESLGDKLGVSRSTIVRHISRLKEDGYAIESAPNKGYALRETFDLLVPRRIRQGLETKAFGKKEIVYCTEIDSTNLKAKDLAANGAPEGAIVISEKQTEGRGRKAREWFSPPRDGIYLSLILRPNIAPRHAPRITLLTAVSVAETLRSLIGLELAIKWPNDILVNGKKLAGILTEMSSEKGAIDYVVVGLGLNVNTPIFPDDIKDTATSLLIETGKRFSRAELVRDYLKWHERYYEIFLSMGFEPIRKRWKELAEIIGQQVTVAAIDREYQGEVQDIDEDGALILQDKAGQVHRITFGDVSLLR
ncbi:MAG TPA: biotin--[acetyl-CoA-carboxylase] ligase [Desulfatiglandales bacterium]|nr:biotin--[acetyl-CoA-carboxylase] ligase [Desulfatiglandales bacterium]